MDLLSPEPGLVIWSGITFLILFLLLRKFAWGPILGAIKEREEKIEMALASAQKASEEYKRIEEAKANMVADAKQERDMMLKEARAMKDSILAEAKENAVVEAQKIVASAKVQIQKEKSDAISELKQQVAKLSVEIAGKLLVEDLKANERQEKIIEKYLNECNFN